MPVKAALEAIDIWQMSGIGVSLCVKLTNWYDSIKIVQKMMTLKFSDFVLMKEQKGQNDQDIMLHCPC